jgi:hypothetical protein
MKLVAQMNHCPPAIEEVVGKYKRSRHIDLQQVLAFAASPLLQFVISVLISFF